MGRRNKIYRRVSHDRSRKTADFRAAEKGLAPLGPSADLRFAGVDRVTVGRYRGKVRQFTPRW
jgi:hypothetical protein